MMRDWGLERHHGSLFAFLLLDHLIPGKLTVMSWRHPDTQERSYGEELRPLANSQVMSYLESRPSDPSQAFGWPQACHHLNCHLMRNPDSWQGHYGLRNPASELTVPSHGPRTHPSGVETGCAAFSVTRNSIRRQWTRSEDTTKQKKNTWSEGKGCTQRGLGQPLRVSCREPPCRSYSCMGTNHKAPHRQTDVTVAQGLPRAAARICWGCRSLTKSEGLYGKDAKTGVWNSLLSALPCPHCQVKQAALPLQGLQGQARQYWAEWEAPQGISFVFPSQVSSSDLKQGNFLAYLKKKKKGLQTLPWADKSTWFVAGT